MEYRRDVKAREVNDKRLDEVSTRRRCNGVHVLPYDALRWETRYRRDRLDKIITFQG